MIALAVGLALAVDPSVKPWPIGHGAGYRPPPAPSAVVAGAPIGGLHCVAPGKTFEVHVELFANRRVIAVPAGIGVATPFRTTLGTVVPKGCTYPLKTLTPTGVVEVATGAPLTLGDLFRVWGQRLESHRLGSFTSRGPVRAYLDGRRVSGSARSLALTRGAEIVLEVGSYVAPHRSFLFPKGS
ncbi:MAG TPA: hypothetical protein VG652_09025 [Gaiellaceae bacterium]|nr:hypothetical protein [Gaiellaceae bacterium]